jgi:hypothetical protein
MVARCQKNHLNHLLRVATIERKSAIDPWRTTISNFLSILFMGAAKPTDHSALWSSFISDMRPLDVDPKLYWTSIIKEQISKTFSCDKVLKGSEKSRDFDFRLGIDPVLWINRLQQLTGSMVVEVVMLMMVDSRYASSANQLITYSLACYGNSHLQFATTW